MTSNSMLPIKSSESLIETGTVSSLVRHEAHTMMTHTTYRLDTDSTCVLTNECRSTGHPPSLVPFVALYTRLLSAYVSYVWLCVRVCVQAMSFASCAVGSLVNITLRVIASTIWTRTRPAPKRSS